MTTKTKLASLTLDRFRGASQRVNIPFSDKPITLLFGENGTGKSSIIDGLEFVLKGTAGSIDDISGATAGTHIPTLNTKAKDVFVEVKLADDTSLSASISGSRIAQQIKGPSTCPDTAFLRRSKILNLVTAKSADRYAALVAFIDVSGVETSEEHLIKAINEQKRSLESITTKVGLASDELQRHFNEQASPDEKDLGYEEWAKKYASQETDQLKKTVDSLSDVIRDYDAANEALKDANKQQTLVESKRKEEKTAQDAFTEAVKKAPGAVDLLIDLLNAGKSYVEAVESIKKCPLCSKPTDRNTLISQIEAQLSGLPGVQTAKANLDKAKDALAQVTNKTWEIYIRFVKNSRTLLRAIDKLDEEYRKDFASPTEFCRLSDLPEMFTKEQVEKEVIASAKSLLSKAEKAVDKWKSEHDKLEPRKTLLSSIRTHYEMLGNGRKEANNIEKVRDHLQAMLDTIRPIRLNFVKAIFASIESDCEHLYAEIHPDEPLGGIRLVLNEARRASCDLMGEFCGEKEIPPQAYYSESHMDTLGFALFLSLAKRGACDDTIIILDDIFTSVDEQHLERLCKLLADEGKKFRQIILATHIRKILDWVGNVLPENIYGVVRLATNWTLKDGIQALLASPGREDIKRLLNDRFLDRSALAGKSRRYLEALTREIVYSVGATGPMKKHGDHELSDYLCGMQAIAKDGWRVVRKPPNPLMPAKPHTLNDFDLRTKLKELNQSKIVVNKNIHATEEGASYTDDELRDFAREVLALDTYLRCDNPDCGSLIPSNKKFLSCACGAIKLEKVPPQPNQQIQGAHP